MSKNRVMVEMDTLETQETSFQPLSIGGREWAQTELVDAIVEELLTDDESKLVRDYFWVVGFKAVKKLLKTGDMDHTCRKMGRPVTFKRDDRRLLAESLDMRDELTAEVLLLTVPDFFEHRVQHWEAAGGASLTTYFIGACIRTFKSAYAVWAKNREQKWIHSARLAEERFTEHLEIEETIRKVYALAKPSQKPVLDLLYIGYSQKEAAEELGLTPRVIEGRMYQLRNRVRHAVRAGAITPPAGFTTASAQGKGPVMI